jgi:hypothetical protein
METPIEEAFEVLGDLYLFLILAIGFLLHELLDLDSELGTESAHR